MNHTHMPDNLRKFNARIVSAENNLRNRPVAIGQKVPEINLPNPEGKEQNYRHRKEKLYLIFGKQ